MMLKQIQQHLPPTALALAEREEAPDRKLEAEVKAIQYKAKAYTLSENAAVLLLLHPLALSASVSLSAINPRLNLRQNRL